MVYSLRTRCTEYRGFLWLFLDFPGGSDGQESAYNAGDLGSILGLERSTGEGNGYPVQYSCLENAMDRGAWQVWGRKDSDLTEGSN